VKKLHGSYKSSFEDNSVHLKAYVLHEGYALDFLFEKIPMLKFRLAGFMALLLVATAVCAKLPVRNMTVELRVLSQADAQTLSLVGSTSAGDNGYVVRARPVQDGDPQVRKVFVVNGEKAQLKLGLSVPVQWVKTALTQSSSNTTASGDVTATGGKGVEHTTAWMDVDQSISVLVRWPGGKQPASVEVEVDMASLESRDEKNVPSQSRSRVATSVLAPLGEWVTIAVTGPRSRPEQLGVYATTASDSEQGKVVQLRVLAP
jgi:hypothetical protein